MIKGKIEFTGETVEAAMEAIEEALARIQGGNTSGFDRNESGSFAFDLTGSAGNLGEK